MPFAETYTPNETRRRTSDNYVKFTPEYRTVLRILDSKARLSWKHWVKEANAGKGMMATCPNTSSQTNACPIDNEIRGLAKDDPKYLDRRARKRFVVNVLDRTPYTVCGSCNTSTPGKKCINCGADLKKNEFTPLNRVKILEHGPKLFASTLNAVEKMQQEDFDVDITGYDIVFQTQGEGRDKQIAAVPQKPEKLSEEDFLDLETGEPQKLWNLDDLVEPNTVEEIELMLKGATAADLAELRVAAVS